jgi:WD40 repeat protein
MKLIKKIFNGTKNNKPLTGKDIGLKAGKTVLRQQAGRDGFPAINPKGETLRRDAGTAPPAPAPPASPGPLAPGVQWNQGDVILDLYEITGFLGRGGMGSVYRVLHRGWGIPLAVKIPQPEASVMQEPGRAEEIYRSFVSEAETWVNLGLHPHVVSCYYVRKLEGFPGVFAEYVEGGSLADRIASRELYRGEPSEVTARLLDFAVQFAWGLEYAHSQGLVHQDVKPANVMVSREGVVKVTDFGLARAVAGAYGQKQSVTGKDILVSVGGMTPAYCSPEQAMGVMLNHQTDIWSWAVSILEMFSGKVTWDSGTAAADALERRVKTGPAAPGIPVLPPGLVSLLRQCFKIQPGERPLRMAEVADRLKEIYGNVVGEDYPRLLPPAGRDTADSLNNRAVSLLDLNREEEADKTWQKALKAQPHHPEATYNLNLTLWRSRELKEDRMLVNSLKDVMKSHGESGYSHLLTAMVHLELGDCRAALQSLEKCGGAEVDPTQVKELMALAKAKLPGSPGTVRVFKGHSGVVKAVALTPDLKLALSGSEDKTLRLWDVKSGSCLKTFSGNNGAVSAIALSGDGQIAVSGSYDGTVMLWDLRRKALIKIFSGHREPVRQVYLSGNGKHILSHSIDGMVIIWETQTGQGIRTFSRLGGGGGIAAVAPGWRFEPGPGNLLYVCGAEGIAVIDMHQAKQVRFIKNAGFKSKGFHLASGGRYGISADLDRKIRIWDLHTGLAVCTLAGHENEVQGVCLSGDHQHVVSGSVDRTLKLWEVSSGVLLRTFTGHSHEVTSVCFSQDNRYALSGSSDYTLRLWRVEHYPFYRAPLVLSRVTSSRETVSLQEQFENHLTAAVRSLSQQNPAAALGQVRLARSLRGFERHHHALELWSNLYHTFPRKALRGGWEAASFNGHQGTVFAASLSKCNTYALTAAADQTLILWDTRTGGKKQTLSGHKKAVVTALLNEKGTIAFSGSRDGTIKQWDLASGRLIRSLPGETNEVRSLALSHDGRFLLAGGSHTPHLWDVAAGHLLRTFKEHPMLVNTVALSSDGQYALTGSNGSNNTLKLWKVASGQCMQTFPGQGG